MVRNIVVVPEKKTRTTKVATQPEIRVHHPSTLMGTIGGEPSIKMAILDVSFQAGDNNFMISEALE